jgi:RNA polymerase sigma factor (TIGR02999 family)
MTYPGDVTRLLSELTGGNRQVLDGLMPAIYEQLRGIAHRALQREDAGHTLTTTALVHEAYLKLVRADTLSWKDRAHFFAICAQAMRRILVDYAVARKRQKRGAGRSQLAIDDVLVAAETRPDDLVELDEALQRLEALDARQARAVECRFFAGMNIEETALALDVSPATVKRDWALARAWLHRELGA